MLDDFGAGYTSLGHLQRYRFDTHEESTPRSSRPNGSGGRPPILRSVVAMAHDLGMDVIAEGAETESDAIELSQIGCEFAQGTGLRPADDRRAGAQIDGRPRPVEGARACEHRGEAGFPSCQRA